MLRDSDVAIKQGKRGMVYDTPAEARAAFNTNVPGSAEKIIETPLAKHVIILQNISKQGKF